MQITKVHASNKVSGLLLLNYRTRLSSDGEFRRHSTAPTGKSSAVGESAINLPRDGQEEADRARMIRRRAVVKMLGKDKARIKGKVTVLTSVVDTNAYLVVRIVQVCGRA